MPTTLKSPPRIALFPDTFEEANGVATLCRHFAEFASAREFPLMVVRGGWQTAFTRNGSVETLQLKRGFASFTVDRNLYFDPLLTRHKKIVLERLNAFKPDFVHITGPGDIGFLGLWVSHILRVPLVASWHTNLHEYLSRRLDRLTSFAPQKLRSAATNAAERQCLRGLLRFYRTTRFVFAPNQNLVQLLSQRTGKPAFLMPHGVDLNQYNPPQENERAADRPFWIGYVGRLTTEKNVRALLQLENKLIAAGEQNYKFLIVGEGGQQQWLQKHLKRAEFIGVQRGDALAAAYSRMDAFVFPSLTDTFGLVLLEAMASGVPVIVSPETGASVGVEDGVSGFCSSDFAASVRLLMHDPARQTLMSREARKLACQHGWPQVFETLYETYIARPDLAAHLPITASK